MPMLHQKLDTMFFGRNRVGVIFSDSLNHLYVGDVKLITTRRAFVCTDSSFDDYARFLREAFNRVENFGWNRGLWHNSLNHATAIAKDGEQKFPALAEVVEPAAYGDSLAVVCADFCDGGNGCGHDSLLLSFRK